MPARRWAVASRWATERPRPPRMPTTVAAYEGDDVLDTRHRRMLTQSLLASDAEACLVGMGHIEPPDFVELERRVPAGARSVRLGDREIEPGFVAMAGPFGIVPVQGEVELNRIRPLLADGWSVAVLSLAQRYVVAGMEDAASYLRAADAPSPMSGLTVLWLGPGDEISLGA